MPVEVGLSFKSCSDCCENVNSDNGIKQSNEELRDKKELSSYTKERSLSIK